MAMVQHVHVGGDLDLGVKVALAQMHSVVGDPEANLHTIDTCAAFASRAGARVLLTPELFVTGYSLDGKRMQELAQHCTLQGEYVDASRDPSPSHRVTWMLRVTHLPRTV